MLFRLSVLLALAGFLASGTSWAMPNFSRKYGVNCSACHTAVPKLNREGFEFRAAGYRFPSDIGVEEQAGRKEGEKPGAASSGFNLGDFFDARIQQYYRYTHTHNAPQAATNVTKNDLHFFELTLYPLTGSWGKYFGSLGEFSMTPGEVFEVENAYVRGAYGTDKGWFLAKVGVMHPWEGIGASDRPLGINRPLFQRNKATNSPFFQWAPDEQAIEAGYYLATTGTMLTGRLSNGITYNESHTDTSPAQGGALVKPPGTPDEKSYQFFANQILSDSSAVSLVYYHGALEFPDPQSAPAPAATGLDKFWRLTAYANYFVVPNLLNLLAGYSYGADNNKNPAIRSTNNTGWFTEANYHFNESVAVGARYENFDPDTHTDRNTQKAGAAFVNYYFLHGLQVQSEYRRISTDRGSAGNRIDDTFELRGIFIW